MLQYSQQGLKSRGIGGFLIRSVIYGVHDRRSVALRLGYLDGTVGMLANLAIFLFKFGLGIVLGSIALTADSFDSLSDSANSLILILGLKISRKPPDRRHPFGHGRAEQIGALIISLMLIVIGGELARVALTRILHPPEYMADWWMIIAVALVIPLKLWLSLFSRVVARAAGSAITESFQWHMRFDVWTSLLVCLGLISSHLGWAAPDGWIGLVIAGLMIYVGIIQVNRRISSLLGETPDISEIQRIEQIAASLRGVDNAHGVVLHRYGDRCMVSLDIEVASQLGLLEAHAISEQVEAEIERNTGCKVVVHLDPVNRQHARYAESEEVLNRILQIHRDKFIGYHDVRLRDTDSGLTLQTDLVVRPHEREEDYPELARMAEEFIAEHLVNLHKAHVKIEPAYYATDAGND